MYTSMREDVFLIVDETQQRFELTYVDSWNRRSVSRCDQLFIILIEVEMNGHISAVEKRFHLQNFCM